MTTPTEVGWEGGLGENDSETLYVYALNAKGERLYRASRVCDVVRRPTQAPFGPAWWVSFAVPVDRKYEHHGPYRTKDEAKAMAIALWRMT